MDYLPYSGNLKVLSRQLRKNLTDAERLLWLKIKRRQIKNYQFTRQKPIGNYIADFYCKKARLVIEVDGGQHYENNNIKKDQKKDESFKKLGLRIIRFTNLDILKNIDNVVDKIYREIDSKTPPSPP